MKTTAITVLLLAVAFGIPASAQPGGGISHGGSHFGGRGFVGPRSIRGFAHRGFRRHDGAFGTGFVPFWWNEPFEYDSYVDSNVDEEVPPEPAAMPPMVIMRERSSLPVTPAVPKMIDVPLQPRTTPAPQQSAVFVLKDGTRLEPQRYLVTADNAYLTTDRRQRTIPLSQLDVDATVKANRERGIELRIPVDRNEISLSF